ncbi:MAG TPA: GNAT family N-acetyltransferase [Anaerolineales bacterium]|nr:GNAT family N-acetyltransferase [Anaerolineales bacterium]
MNGPKFRPYRSEDKDRCIEIFMSNTPRYFGVEEMDEFRQFLENLPCAYFVATQNDEIVACGGHGYHGTKQAIVLCWGMVPAEFHKQRLGEFMLIERLRHIYKDFGPTIVQIDTSQHSQGFFERYGFQVKEVTDNYFAAGLHRVAMELQLNGEHHRILISKVEIHQ